MRQATRFMRECCFTKFQSPEMVGMWEPAHLTHGSPRAVYKLGGAGLALVALSSIEAVDPGSASLSEAQGLAAFGKYLMKWDGGFYPRYVPSKGGRQSSGEVLYYPGEMILGWTAMYDHHPSPELMEWSVKGLMHLARERAREGEAPPDHWALLATAELFRLAQRDHVEIPRQALLVQAIQICHGILEDGYAPPAFPQMDGALVARGHVVSTAARLEGLLAALTFLPRGHPITAHVESAVHRGVAFLLRAQVKDGQYAGGMPLAIMLLPPGSGIDVDKFNQQATEIRVDHLQHSLSAMAQYLEGVTAEKS
jgi:hypothetical protein